MVKEIILFEGLVYLSFCCKFELMINSEQQQIIKETTARFNPSLVGVFGSYAHGEQTQFTSAHRARK